jgi:hypothetical protein
MYRADLGSICGREYIVRNLTAALVLLSESVGVTLKHSTLLPDYRENVLLFEHFFHDSPRQMSGTIVPSDEARQDPRWTRSGTAWAPTRHRREARDGSPVFAHQVFGRGDFGFFVLPLRGGGCPQTLAHERNRRRAKGDTERYQISQQLSAIPVYLHQHLQEGSLPLIRPRGPRAR